MDEGKWLFIYQNYLFLIGEGVQAPDHYSLFFAENFLLNPGETALDLTTGSGFHAIMLASRASRVVGVDINPLCVRCARHNVLLNGLEKIVEIRQGDLFSALSSEERFDLIVAWPPLLPTRPGKERNDWFGVANEGGPDGRRVIDRIIAGVAFFLRPNGRLQLMQPWYTDIDKSLQALRVIGFEVAITAERYFPVGVLSYERAEYLAEIGFPLIEQDGQLLQHHALITARRL